jgi:hypothetical protein
MSDENVVINDNLEQITPEEVIEDNLEGEAQDESEDSPQDETVEDTGEEFEEVEINGVKYQVPKELKGSLMMQADYTRKTQEVAEMRKALEIERQQEQQKFELMRETEQARTELKLIDKQLDSYQGIDWQAFIRENPVEAMLAQQTYQQLRESRTALSTNITATEQNLAYAQQVQLVEKMQKAQEELKRDIPNWSPEVGKQLAEFGVTLGFSQEEMSQVYDPRLVKLLHAAMTGRQLVQGKVDQAKTAPKVEVKPVRKVAGTSSPAAKDPNRMSTEEWMRSRNEQISKKGR